MTNKEAIETISKIKECYNIYKCSVDCATCPHHVTDEKYSDAMELAKKAIAKQVPKNPIEKPEKYNENLWHLYCPSCKNWIGMWNNRLKHRNMYNNSNSHICPHCGQAIDWTEDE